MGDHFVTGVVKDFHKLIDSARKGDRQAIREVVRIFWPILGRWFVRFIHNRDEAEEACQSFFLHLLEKDLLCKSRGTTLAELRAYLTTCARNFVHSNWKRWTSLEGESLQTSEDWPGDLSGRAVDLFADSAENAYFSRLEVQTLLQAIDALELPRRTVVYLSLQGYKNNEIAKILEIPANTVASHLMRARDQLRAALRSEGIS